MLSSQLTTASLLEMIASHDVLLFMKGTPHCPQCGFSAEAVRALQHADLAFDYYDLVSDHNARKELPKISGVPSFPQLFIAGKCIGDLSAIKQYYENSTKKV